MTDTKQDRTIPADLIQLPNGNWVAPFNVVGIQYMPPATGAVYPDGGVPDRVRVDLLGGDYEFIAFDDAIAAAAFRDGLAQQVNAARQSMRAAKAEE